ncbi:hypothetical protein H4R22_004012 [Coemansia sp. RSA 1290]|nr:domain of Kin17 curved DNA-binding protein-domain-containing protein [Coemansia mojavensis]KAJ1743790.1 hypothetical protein LPJ68_000596 [Coemansia sp. RSA 1086]KAJ1751819.1 hypothetical protein LPJ79_001779 [Coemansia sp. RSA 1821]KAJ2628209.1 hypothetical protein H4R22_004012 [Coemansia sp. RSA 1290]KAJ2652506.1 hypothetical protein IWW40_000991 [Coemansia sp. RSA 1250]
MPKHDFFSPKAVANRIKAKGLQRLRWYCQMCEKQCRDENGFKCHCASESHQRQMAIFAENPGRHLSQFSQEFEQAFLSVLSRRFGTKKVPANQVYQEIVADRQHLHMNATRWNTLSDFVKYLGREGKCKVEDSERGWMIEWIDTSPEALARKAAIMKKERQEMDDEQREQQLLKEQIERAKKAQVQAGTEATGLVRKEAKPIKLSLKPPASSGTSLLKPNKLAKPIVKSNPFRKAASSLSMQTNKTEAASQHKQTAVEELMQQDLRRKETRRNRSRSPQSPRYNRRRSRSPYR